MPVAEGERDRPLVREKTEIMQTTAVPNADDMRTERILAHTALAKGIALRLAGRVPKSVDIDDLIAAGMLGLIDAADRFDASRGIPFEAYSRRRIQGVQITTGRHVVSATPSSNRISLTLDDGSTRRADHVLLATGYRVDVSRYEFLSPEILQCLSQVNGYPQLARGFESSIPGLHFVGAPAAWSFGPLMRFVAGTEFAGPALVRRVRRDAKRASVATGALETSPA